MFNLKTKFKQIKEYNRLNDDYRLKRVHAFEMFLAWARAVRAITYEYPLSQQLPIENNSDAFGTNDFPCLVDKFSGERYKLGILVGIECAQNFVCPNFSKDKPCEKTACRYHHAHQEYVDANKDYHIALREFNKAEVLRNAARERAFGRKK